MTHGLVEQLAVLPRLAWRVLVLQGAISVLQGSCDLKAFSRALSKEYGSGYYTDDYEHYTQALERCHDLLKNIPVPPAAPVTGYPELSPDPRGDPSTWPKEEASGEASTGPSPAPPPSPPAPAPAAAPPGERVLARVKIPATRGGAPLRIRIDRAAISTPAPVTPTLATQPFATTTKVAAPVTPAPASTAVTSTPVSAISPPRPQPGEPRRGGRAWLVEIAEVTGRDGPEAREASFRAEIEKGNHPSFMNLFAPVTMTDKAGRNATFMVSVDYVAVGTDDVMGQ